jgi:hypothetical protein
LPELRGFLCDHVALTVEDNVEFHWLFPGDELSSGLRRLVDDKACLYMSDCISEDGVAEIYVETFRLNGGDGEVQGGSQGRTVQDQTRRDKRMRRDCPFTPLLLKMIKMEKVKSIMEASKYQGDCVA